MEKFNYLGVVFMSDGREDEELNTRMGKASAVMRVAIFGCHETRIDEKSKALSLQNRFKELRYLTKCVALKFENL